MKILTKKKYIELESYKLKNIDLENKIQKLYSIIDCYEKHIENICKDLYKIQNDLKGTVRKTTIRRKVKEILKTEGWEK